MGNKSLHVMIWQTALNEISHLIHFKATEVTPCGRFETTNRDIKRHCRLTHICAVYMHSPYIPTNIIAQTFTSHKKGSINSIMFHRFQDCNKTVNLQQRWALTVEYVHVLGGSLKSNHFIVCGQQWLLHPSLMDNHVSLSGMREA